MRESEKPITSEQLRISTSHMLNLWKIVGAVALVALAVYLDSQWRG